MGKEGWVTPDVVGRERDVAVGGADGRSGRAAVVVVSA